MKKLFIILALLLTYIFSINAYKSDYSKGPLFGKNLFIPHAYYLNFPGYRAKASREHKLSYHFSIYYTNDFLLLNRKEVIIDYESLVAETGAHFSPKKNHNFGITFRFFSYYGGFMDRVIEQFHYMFVPPEYYADRKYHVRNKVLIDIPNYNGIKYRLNKNAFGIGDTDLFYKWTVFSHKNLIIANLFGFKIPTGQTQILSGSGFPDFGYQVLVDILPFRFLSLYFQPGVVFPFDSICPFFESRPYPIGTVISSIEIHPFSFLSIISQLNIRTSPIQGPDIDTPHLAKYKYILSSPQINVLGGGKIRIKNITCQIYVEENNFTNAGADVTFNVMFSYGSL